MGRIIGIPAANLVTAASGGFFGIQLSPQSGGTVTAALTGANTVKAVEFVLPHYCIVRKVVSEVTTTFNGGLYAVGLYNAAKTVLLVDSGAILTTTAQVNTITLATPVALPPGVYWLAYTGDNTTFVLRGLTTGGTASYNMMTKNAARMGGAANASAAGVLPATLGAITIGPLNAAAVYFEP